MTLDLAKLRALIAAAPGYSMRDECAVCQASLVRDSLPYCDDHAQPGEDDCDEWIAKNVLQEAATKALWDAASELVEAAAVLERLRTALSEQWTEEAARVGAMKELIDGGKPVASCAKYYEAKGARDALEKLTAVERERNCK